MSESQKHIVIDARNRSASTGRYTERLVEHLQDVDKSNRFTVLTQPNDDWEMKNKNFKTVPCRFQQFSFSPIEQIAFAWQLYKLKPDLVHFTMTQQPLLYFGRNVTTTHDLTMLYYTRANRFPKPVHKVAMGLYRFLLWWTHIKTKKIIVPSRYVADDLASHQSFTKNKLVVVYEGGEMPIQRDPSRPEGVRQPFIFHAGSPFPHKNIYRLIEAFELLLGKQADLQLVLAGKKEHYFEELEAWAKKRDSYKSMVFTGYIPDEQLKWLYQNAAAYVLPSLSEGFGLPGLEAMAHGCPVVASNATCLPEIYGPAAEFFDPEDTENMAFAISEVIPNSSRRERLIEAGKAQIKEYSWNKMAEETLAIYRQTLG